MRVAIFGASSASGKLLVKEALAKGYEVAAFIRDESKLGISKPNLNVICGNALNPADVEKAIQGSDAVLSTLGPKGKPAVMAAQSTRYIVTAMEKHAVKRLVVVSVAGVAVPQDQRGFNLIDKLMRALLRDVYTDRENQLTVLESSQLEWVAVRVPRLTDKPATGFIKAFLGNPSPRMKISRSDLAEFMLQQVTDDKWLRQAPIVSN